MWIKMLPKDYAEMGSASLNEVFLWNSGNIYVMDNHKSALWCWLQVCESKKQYNFMHIDAHNDILECYDSAELIVLGDNPHMSYEDYSGLTGRKSGCKVVRWDNYIMAGYFLRPEWFHTNIFMTQQEYELDRDMTLDGLIPRKENALYMESMIQQFIGDHYQFLDGFKDNDYKLHWIVNLDLDVFYTKYSHVQLFSDDYIRRIAELLQTYLKRIAVLTIAISPECLGGKHLKDKWKNGFRILRIMSEKLECLKDLVNAAEE